MVHVANTSSARNTAEKLVALVMYVFGILSTVWGVTYVALTTDASGESKKARRLIRECFLWLVTPDCYAHQVIFLGHVDLFTLLLIRV